MTISTQNDISAGTSNVFPAIAIRARSTKMAVNIPTVYSSTMDKARWKPLIILKASSSLALIAATESAVISSIDIVLVLVAAAISVAMIMSSIIVCVIN